MDDLGPDVEFENHLEFTLIPGERYGWWSEHALIGEKRKMAMVHGAIFNHRIQVVLDTGATTSIMSLDLARRLKLKLRRTHRLRVLGYGDVPTYVTAQARVKLTLGVRVVYVLDVWVGNIGEGMECLLGMDFMVAAGVRLCAREGVVRLPDEESLILVGGPEVDHVGMEFEVRLSETAWLPPGSSITLPVKYSCAEPDKMVAWAGRGKQWVTQFIYGTNRLPRAVRAVNVSDQVARIEQHPAIATLVKRNYLPQWECFARPKSQKYREWSQLIFEAEPSSEFAKREEEVARLEALRAPPAVEKPSYAWPKKILLRKKSAENSLSPVEPVDRTAVSAYMMQTVPGPNPEGRSQLQPVDPPAWSESSPRNDAMTNMRRDDTGDDGTSQPEVLSSRGGQRSIEEDSSSNSPGLSGGGDTSQNAKCELERVYVNRPDNISTEPISRLHEEFSHCLRIDIEEANEEATVYFHEGSELLSDLRDQLAALPDLRDLSPNADLGKADVGVSGVTTPAMNNQVQAILERHHAIFLGDGNAVPTPARGVVCDLDVGDATPIAQRSRPIRPHHLQKVYDLLKKLLETKLIEYSDSEWASPIVIVMKKNGVDIRPCIDFRLVNQLIKLMHYPLPLIDDLLIGFENVMWFLSLDMASGFWAVPMTLRAKHISAFICPLGHFQWTRMPFGLKNAPLIYQQMLNNCLWGFVRLPPEQEAMVDADVLEFLGIKTEDQSEKNEIPMLTENMTVFRRNIPAPPALDPVLGRSSYIDDIAYGAETWEQLCIDLNRLLYRLRYWGISVSLPKSEFGKKMIPYLSHEISAEGIRAKPKIAKGVKNLPFPSTLKGVQSFLGSLNYYNKFIEDLPVVASVLYELTDEQIQAGRDLSRAKEAFEILKEKIVSTPLLRHPNREKPFVIIVHANPWAVSAVLGQEYDGIIFPVRFTGRVLHDQELRYHPAEKEVVVLLRVLRLFYTMLAGSKLVKVYTRYSVLKWLFRSQSLEGRCEQWRVYHPGR